MTSSAATTVGEENKNPNKIARLAAFPSTSYFLARWNVAVFL
jgi:hypothetical protein